MEIQVKITGDDVGSSNSCAILSTINKIMQVLTRCSHETEHITK